MTQLRIDGRDVTAAPGASVLDAALAAGVYLPHLCSHPDLPAAGGCGVCTVTVDGSTTPVRACVTPATEGLDVATTSPAAVRARTLALELLLAGHPKDCTSCPAHLNCELQALMQHTGVTHSRMRDTAVQLPVADDAVLRRDPSRCVACGRCVRACADLRGVGVLELRREGGATVAGVVGGTDLTATGCRLCSACVEVCPTGAITDLPGLFASQPPRPADMVPCSTACPAHTDIPRYLELAGRGRYGDAVAVFREKLTFPLSLGHVCSHPCEASCKRGHVDAPLQVRAVKRFAVEHDADAAWRRRVHRRPATGRRVAVVGGGPAGLTAAHLLARAGHTVTVHEAQERPGGMLSFGIPRHRLPREVVDGEVELLRSLAPFEVLTSSRVDDVVGLLAAGADAVVLAAGAGAGRRPAGFAGPWPNVVDGVELCRRAARDGLPGDLGERVLVFGGGNVGLDCARTAVRAGASEVRVLCLEPDGATPGDPEEIADALAEGVLLTGSRSLASVREAGGRVVAAVLDTVRSFAFGPGGVRVDVEPGGRHELPVDTLVLATGQRPDLAAPGVALTPGGLVAVTGTATSVPGVFAAGDVVTGTRSVVAAIAGGRAAAADADRHLGGDGDLDETYLDRERPDPRIGAVPGFAPRPRVACDDPEGVAAETSRCLRCQLRQDVSPPRTWNDPAFRTAAQEVRA